MSHYIPGNPPDEPEALRQFVQDELYRINNHISNNKWNHSFKKITASETIGDTPYVFADASAAALTVTLPDPPDDMILNVEKIDSSANLVTLSSASLIDGFTAVGITFQYDSLTVYWDNGTWNIV